MKKMVLLLIVFVFVLTGCGSSNSGAEVSEISEVSGILKERLGISPYIPEIDYELTAVILEYLYLEDQEPFGATLNYYESLDGLTAGNEEAMKQWEENFPERELVYGTLYVEPAVITIGIYLAGEYEMGDGEIIEIAGHEIQYLFLKEGTDGRDSDDILMAMHFDDVTYSIRYSVQSDNFEEAAKELAEDIIKNNS